MIITDWAILTLIDRCGKLPLKCATSPPNVGDEVLGTDFFGPRRSTKNIGQVKIIKTRCKFWTIIEACRQCIIGTHL